MSVLTLLKETTTQLFNSSNQNTFVFDKKSNISDEPPNEIPPTDTHSTTVSTHSNLITVPVTQILENESNIPNHGGSFALSI